MIRTSGQNFKIVKRIGALVLFALLLFLTFNKHSRTDSFTYQSQIWSDKAGYYIYLPAVFHLSFNSSAYPKEFDTKTGDGFDLNHPSGILRTKYTYGVALLQSPFYAVASAIDNNDSDVPGFSKTHHQFIDIAAVIYLCLGLIFAYKYLRFQYSFWPSTLSTVLLLIGTNLFYYGIEDTGMSHVYSFFLFALLLYSFKSTQWLSKANSYQLVAIGLTVGIALLVRPTNLLFIGILFCLEIDSVTLFRQRLRHLFKFKPIVLLVLPVVLIWIPQLSYWHSLTGNFFHYSYSNEGFNFFQPELANFLVSPAGGWLVYSPLIIVLIVILIWFGFQKKVHAWVIAAGLIMVVYIFSSWWDWHYGCSFGSRPMVEFGVLFLLPTAAFLRHLSQKSIYSKIVFGSIVLVFSFVNLKLSYTFDHCFFGATAWDWNEYFDLLSK